MCRCLSRHWFLNFCTLNSFKLCTHQWMCTSSYTQAFPFFLLLSWVCLYWFSCVQLRRCSGSTTCDLQSTASTSWGSTADMESLATDRKTVWNMHAPDVRACPWHRLCFRQIELVKRSCWSLPPPEIAFLPPFSSCPKTVHVFPRVPPVAEPLTYPSPADIPVLYSRVLPNKFWEISP